VTVPVNSHHHIAADKGYGKAGAGDELPLGIAAGGCTLLALGSVRRAADAGNDHKTERLDASPNCSQTSTGKPEVIRGQGRVLIPRRALFLAKRGAVICLSIAAKVYWL